MKRSPVELIVAFTLPAAFCMLSACAQPRASAPSPAPYEKDGGSDATKKDKPVAKADDTKAADEKAARELEIKLSRMERELNIARGRLERARTDVANQEITNRESISRAETELDFARRGFAQFVDFDSKARVERATLGLQQMEDAVAESREELEQIEAMYKDNDIADKTKEIVVKRTRRHLANMEKSFMLQKAEFDNLQSKTLPLERAKVALEVDTKEKALEAARRQARDSMKDRELALLAAEAEVARIEADFATARRERKS